MRASYAALVLATVAITHVAAGPLKHNHAHFHEKKEAELKVEQTIEERAVDWSKVSYTYSVGQTWGQPTAAPAPVNAAAAPAAPAVPTSAAAAPAAATSAAKAAASSAPASSSSASESTVILTDADKARLTSMGALVGANSQTPTGHSWIGQGGYFEMDVINSSGEDIIVIVWGNFGSWINTNQPTVTHSLGAGQKTTISFANGAIGAMGAAYPDTTMSNGQLKTTWVEFSLGGYATVDISKEVFMGGREASIVTPLGCVSNFEKCFFSCLAANVDSCITGYQLNACDNGSQPGAQYGMFDGAPSGGCGCGNGGTLTTTFL